MKIKTIISLIIISALLSGCGVTSEESFSPTESLLSIDYSRVINSLPGHDDNIYETHEELLGVTESPKRIVGRHNKENLKEKYETLATDVYTLYLFEHEDGTASQMYKYYFFDSKESYDEAYNAFCISNGSPSIKNEKSLFFGNGGSAELYVSGRPIFSDISLYFQINKIEVIKSWSGEEASDISDAVSSTDVSNNA
jgi:hypothetical protein